MAKYKMTPFARFFIFLIIASPIMYFVAAYYNGLDPIQQIQSFFDRDPIEKVEQDPKAEIDSSALSQNTKDTLESDSPELQEESGSIRAPQSLQKELQQKNDSLEILKRKLLECMGNK